MQIFPKNLIVGSCLFVVEYYNKIVGIVLGEYRVEIILYAEWKIAAITRYSQAHW
jgi:hypothetical protein